MTMSDAKGRSAGRVVHALPGRVRICFPQIKRNPARAQEVKGILAGLPGVEGVSANTTTGSVVIEYDTRQMEVLVDSAKGAMAQLGAEGEDVRRWLVPPVDEISAEWDIAQLLLSRLGAVNRLVKDLTGGLDLRTLVPLALFFLGVRSLAVSKKPLPPDWHTLFWFAFATFIALNPLPPPPAANR